MYLHLSLEIAFSILVVQLIVSGFVLTEFLHHQMKSMIPFSTAVLRKSQILLFHEGETFTCLLQEILKICEKQQICVRLLWETTNLQQHKSLSSSILQPLAEPVQLLSGSHLTLSLPTPVLVTLSVPLSLESRQSFHKLRTSREALLSGKADAASLL